MKVKLEVHLVNVDTGDLASAVSAESKPVEVNQKQATAMLSIARNAIEDIATMTAVILHAR